MRPYVLAVLDEPVLQLLLQVVASLTDRAHAVDNVDRQMEPVEVVTHRHVERRGDRSFLFVPAHVDAVVVGATVSQAMDQPRVRMKREDDGLVASEEIDEVRIGQSVRMLARRLQPHQVYDIYDTNTQFGQMLAQDRHRGERFERRYVAATGHDDVRLDVPIVAGPLPDADALRAVLDGLVHRQPLRCGMLPGYDHVDVVAAAQAV